MLKLKFFSCVYTPHIGSALNLYMPRGFKAYREFHLWRWLHFAIELFNELFISLFVFVEYKYKIRSAIILNFKFLVLPLIGLLLSVYYLSMSSQFAAPELPPTWDHTPEQIISITKDFIDRYVKFNDETVLIETPTVQNLLLPFAEFENENLRFQTQIPFYQYVLDNKELREAGQEATRLINEAIIEQELRVDRYQVFKKLYDSKPEFTDSETKRLLDKVILEFERNGLHLDEEKRSELKVLQNKINDLSLEFSKNTIEEDGFVLFTREELSGLNEDTIKQYETEVDESTGETLYKMTFKYPDFLPLMKHAKVQETRKRAFNGDANKLKQNHDILLQLVQQRFKLAKILGYNTFSEYVLEDRLAKTETRVLDFLTDLKTKLSPLGKKELAKLKELKDEDFTKQKLSLQDEYYIWDNRFYDNLMLEEEYQVNTDKISQYFPLQSTISKMFGFYETLFDIKFVETTTEKRVWHDEVQQFAVYQNIKFGETKNIFLGWLYLDLHPRKGKYGHAANFGLLPAYDKGSDKVRPVTALVCNFTKPSKEKPSLLKHDEVVTFFHELGHGIHDLLGFTKYARFHGTQVPRDFVEAPSQCLEYWTWSKDELKHLSSHYETGQPIPNDLIDQLIKSKNVNGALGNLRQLHFALFDMKLHTISKEEDISKLDILKLWNDLREELSFISNGGEYTYGYGSFGHIAGGYESGYYGYLFSKVYADDIYYSIFKNDPLNTENGIKYRDSILARGGSRDVLEGVVELLGREPNLNAFLTELGL